VSPSAVFFCCLQVSCHHYTNTYYTSCYLCRRCFLTHGFLRATHLRLSLGNYVFLNFDLLHSSTTTPVLASTRTTSYDMSTDELIFDLEMEAEKPIVGNDGLVSSSVTSSSPSTDTSFSSECLTEGTLDSVDDELPYFAQYHANRIKPKQSITPPIPIASTTTTTRSQPIVPWHRTSDTNILNSLEKDSERVRCVVSCFSCKFHNETAATAHSFLTVTQFVPPHELVERSGFSLWKKETRYRAHRQFAQ
jgi:hypothetical protein